MRKMRWHMGFLALVMGITAGCGGGTPAAAGHATVRSSAAVPSVPPSSTPAPSSPAQASSTSAAPPPSFSGSVWSPVAPAGVGSPAGLKVSVLNVTPDGQSGNKKVYLVDLSLTNITSSMILLTLNEFNVVAPGHTTLYSDNDLVGRGLTSENSLFPYPLTPKDPIATTVEIPSGAQVNGDVTVIVPPASAYTVLLAGAELPAAHFAP
jgi:hypothetical protein